ncbi:MAG: hypothetical protein LQ338_003958 [Usnochroma carphineum]|nr:MAG: hypothetical protein LQ338_003958 [Usnochroma carphineum]
MDLPHRSKPSVTYGVDTEVAGKLGGKDGFDLLERGYRAWFPRRRADRDVRGGEQGWWREGREGKTKAEETEELVQVWRFHEVFCEQLKTLAVGIEASRVGKWEVRESFAEVVMIVEAGWTEQGVALVWKEEPVGEFVGFAAEELGTVEEEGRDGFWELRCSLERAIRIVASRDLERRGRKEEWNEALEETLIDDEDDRHDNPLESEATFSR